MMRLYESEVLLWIVEYKGLFFLFFAHQAKPKAAVLPPKLKAQLPVYATSASNNHT